MNTIVKETSKNGVYVYLLRAAAVLLALGGLIYIVIQPFHPADALESVGTVRWFAIALSTSLMSLFVFLGIQGVYLATAQKGGVTGFIGFLLFSLFWLLSMVFSFIEAFVYPLLTESAPAFVSGMTGLFAAAVSEVSLGAFPALTTVSGLLYIGGSIVFAVGQLKSSKKPLLPVSLMVAGLLTVGAGIVAHPFDRLFAVPMGLVLIAMGFNLFREAGREN